MDGVKQKFYVNSSVPLTYKKEVNNVVKAVKIPLLKKGVRRFWRGVFCR
jgi:hypothetical protein